MTEPEGTCSSTEIYDEDQILSNGLRMLGSPELHLTKPMFATLLGQYQRLYEHHKQLIRRGDQAQYRMQGLHDRLERSLRENAAHADELKELVSALRQQVEAKDRIVACLERYFPEPVRKRILEVGNMPVFETHRQEITSVFCDLRGFTEFSYRAPPEEVIVVLQAYHSALGECIARFGGTPGSFAGDGVMIFFNDPDPIPRPELQAVQMAMAMREAMQKLVTQWKGDEHELGFGVGIDRGYASIGPVGFEGRQDYAAIGESVNRAARLCSVARHDQILISAKVAGQVSKEVKVESAGAFKLKGCGPTQAFNVIGPQSGVLQ